MTRTRKASTRPQWQPVSLLPLAGWLFCLTVAASAAWGQSAEAGKEKDGDNEKASHAARGESSWVPTIRAGFNVVNQDLDGATRAVQLDPSPILWARILRQDSSEGTLRNLFFDGQVGLFAPAFYEGGLAPRLFAYAGGEIPFTDRFDALRSVTARQDTFTVGFCGGQTVTSEAIPGVQPERRQPDLRSCAIQSRNQVIVDGFWYAGLGVDITLPIFGRSFHLRPSLGYFGQRWMGSAEIEASKFSYSGTEFTNEIVSGSSSKQIAHGIGPAIELGIEVARLGPVSIDIYLESRFAWMLSGRKARYTSDRSSCQLETLGVVQPACRYIGDPRPLPNTANVATRDISGDFESSIGRFVAQGGAGLRFRWTGSLLGGS